MENILSTNSWGKLFIWLRAVLKNKLIKVTAKALRKKKATSNYFLTATMKGDSILIHIFQKPCFQRHSYICLPDETQTLSYWHLLKKKFKDVVFDLRKSPRKTYRVFSTVKFLIGIINICK